MLESSGCASRQIHLPSQDHVFARAPLVSETFLSEREWATDKCRYAIKDTTNRELQSLAQETFEQLLEWRSTLPVEVDIDVTSLGNKVVLPHVLGLQ